MTLRLCTLRELKIPFVVGSIDIKKLVGTMFQKKYKYQ